MHDNQNWNFRRSNGASPVPRKMSAITKAAGFVSLFIPLFATDLAWTQDFSWCCLSRPSGLQSSVTNCQFPVPVWVIIFLCQQLTKLQITGGQRLAMIAVCLWTSCLHIFSWFLLWQSIFQPEYFSFSCRQSCTLSPSQLTSFPVHWSSCTRKSLDSFENCEYCCILC